MTAIPPEIFEKIRRIQFQTTQLAEDFLAGPYRSAFKGQGMEFEEVREFQPGDEVRNIDWNVTARMNHHYVKTFREERELTVMLIVDISSSSRFGSHNQLKRDLIAEIGAALAFSATKNNDRIGLILFSREVEKYVPPKKGLRHVLRIIRELLVYEPKYPETDLGAALSYLGGVQRRLSICFLISDFICPDYTQKLAVTSRQHDLIAIGITDPYELDFPNMNLVTMVDLETGKSSVVDTSDAKVREHFQKVARDRLEQTDKLMKKIGAGFIDIRTDQPYMPRIRKFFRLREIKH